jgi:hypothetical protein
MKWAIENHCKNNPNQFCVFFAKLILFHDADRPEQYEGSIAVILIFNFFMIALSSNLGSILPDLSFLICLEC